MLFRCHSSSRGSLDTLPADGWMSAPHTHAHRQSFACSAVIRHTSTARKAFYGSSRPATLASHMQNLKTTRWKLFVLCTASLLVPCLLLCSAAVKSARLARTTARLLARPTMSNPHRTGHASDPRDPLCRHGLPKARSGGAAARARVHEQSEPETYAGKLVLCLRSELSSLGTQQLSAVSSAATTQLTALCRSGHDNEVVIALAQVQSCLQHKMAFVTAYRHEVSKRRSL